MCVLTRVAEITAITQVKTGNPARRDLLMTSDYKPNTTDLVYWVYGRLFCAVG